MTRLDSHVNGYLQSTPASTMGPEQVGELVNRVRAHDQMVFLFAHVLNEIQNGPISEDYVRLVEELSPADALVTFNWDTLLDRALNSATDWEPDGGYLIPFSLVLDGHWRDRVGGLANNHWSLLKLHGSTNWLVNYMTWNLTTGDRVMVVPEEPNPDKARVATDPMILEAFASGPYEGPRIRDTNWGDTPPPGPDDEHGWPVLFIRSDSAYAAYKDRFRDGYQPYSYFFPPNDPRNDIPLMPVMVPPTRYKLYEEFEHVLNPLWDEATKRMLDSDEVYLVGYSLPETDSRTQNMFAQVAKAGSPVWVVVNPTPAPIAARLIEHSEVDEGKIQIEKATLKEFLG